MKQTRLRSPLETRYCTLICKPPAAVKLQQEILCAIYGWKVQLISRPVVNTIASEEIDLPPDLPGTERGPNKSEPLYQHIWDEGWRWYVSRCVLPLYGASRLSPESCLFCQVWTSWQASSSSAYPRSHLRPVSLFWVPWLWARFQVRATGRVSGVVSFLHTAGGTCAHLNRATGLLTLQTLHNTKSN